MYFLVGTDPEKSKFRIGFKYRFLDPKGRLAESEVGLMVAPKVWAYVANASDTNPDLEQYGGYFDLKLKFGKADSVVVGTHLRWAEQGGSVQADFTYPLSRLLFDSLELYFHFQYVNALAESLIDHKERTVAFRLGFSIVRWSEAAAAIACCGPSRNTSLPRGFPS